MRNDKDGKIGGRKARKLWRLGEVGTASKIVRMNTEARAHLEVIEIVAIIADVP